LLCRIPEKKVWGVKAIIGVAMLSILLCAKQSFAGSFCFHNGTDLQELANATISICLPTGIKSQQDTAIDAKYLKDHPEEWNKTGAQLVLKALTPSYVCRRNN